MARLQILELPEGTDDSRPPFVLVVDEIVPQRVILGMDHGYVGDFWQSVAEQIGARGVIVTPETVEIPANDVSGFTLEGTTDEQGDVSDDDPEWRARHLEGKLKEFAEASYREGLDRMDAVTNALGLDRLRDWDEIVTALRAYRAAAEQLGKAQTPEPAKPFVPHARPLLQDDADGGHRFDVPGYQDPIRCAQCGMDGQSWLTGRDRRSCDQVQADAESGHDFRPLDPGGLACLRCGMPRVKWAASLLPQDCDAVRKAG